MWKVLIVDDSVGNGELLTAVLEHMAECVVANNGDEGIDIFKKALEEGEAPFDCILLDIEMPGHSGLEVLQSIRKIEEGQQLKIAKSIPILMITEHKQYFIEAFNLGCTDYILKPIDPMKVIKKIHNRLVEKSSVE